MSERMSAKSPRDGKLLYHMIHINNMPSILASGLRSRRELLQRQGGFQDIADPDIISGRENYQVALSQYVPFHFFAKNPFDCAVAARFGAENMVLISIRRDYAEQNGAFIIPSHPLNTNTPELLPYAEGFERVNWDLMAPGRRNYQQDPVTKQASMAECDMP